MSLDHSARYHSRVSPSSLHRALACPGSVALSAKVPPSPNSHASIRGTAGHELTQTCYETGRSPHEFVGTFVNGFAVDDDLADAAQVVLNYYLDRSIGPDDIVWFERRFDLSSRLCREFTGSADFMHHASLLGLLEVVDAKFGVVPVTVEGNVQLLSYALMALLELSKECRAVSLVRITIVQPGRMDGQPAVQSVDVTLEELRAFARTLEDGLLATVADNAPRQAGDHCGYCPAGGVCPELANRSLAVAEAQFDGPTRTLPPDPVDLSPERISRILDAADVLDDWLTAVRGRASGLLNEGAEVPGWKLVQKRAIRKWADDALAAVHLSNLGLPEDDHSPRKVLSPAQAEKLLPKSKRGDIAAIVVAESSGTTLARAGDKRPAVTSSIETQFTQIGA